MDNEEYKKKRDDRTEDLIFQIQKHDYHIANIVKNAYDRGYSDGNSQKDFKIVKITCDSYTEGFEDGVDQGIKLSEKPQGKWIPVSKKLPVRRKEVIVTDIETSDTYVSRYIGNEYWECDNGTFKNRIIAWQPLPEPYKRCADENTEEEKPIGRWIPHEDWHLNLRYGCNICGSVTKEKYPRCPTCKSKMEVDEE